MDHTPSYRSALGLGPKAGLAALASLCGIWTQHVWIFWMNTNNHALPDTVPWQTIYLVLSVAMMALGVLYGRRGRTPAMPGPAWAGVTAAALECVAAAVVAALTLGGGSPALAVAALVAGGIGFGWLNLAWGVFFSRLDIRQAVAFLFAGGIAGSLVKAAVALVPPVAAGAVAALLAPLSLAMIRYNFSHVPEAPKVPAHFTGANITALWKAVAVFAVFSVANASMLALRPPMESVGPMPVFMAERLLECVLCAAVLVYVFRFRRPLGFMTLWRLVLLLLATNFLLNIALPASGLQTLFSGASLNFIVLFVWLTLSDVSHHSDLAPSLIFGFGWSCYALPFFLGSWLVALGGFTLESTGYLAFLMYVIALVAVFCLETRDQSMGLIFADLNRKSRAAPEDFSSIDARCAALGECYGLTAREVEVMQMLCKGRSKAYIAEALYVTENTVEGHAKRLYVKLDVHSRKELQQLVDAG